MSLLFKIVFCYDVSFSGYFAIPEDEYIMKKMTSGERTALALNTRIEPEQVSKGQWPWFG